jgi:hypothetical protein
MSEARQRHVWQMTQQTHMQHTQCSSSNAHAPSSMVLSGAHGTPGAKLDSSCQGPKLPG